jgi:purine-binding chemotaxis protein CheW
MTQAQISPEHANTVRSQSAASTGDACSLLRMAVGREVLAVSIDTVREILEVGRLTALPRTPSFVRGVMNLRGAVVPVVDLSARLGHAETVVGRRSCIVVVEVNGTDAHDGSSDECFDRGLVVGLLVDAVFEVFDTDTSHIEAVPMLGTSVRADYLSGMARAHGQVVGVLAIDRVLSLGDLSQAIASYQPH